MLSHMKVLNEHVLLKFISIQTPNDPKDLNKRREARSHAIKQALESKRKAQRQTSDNFRVTGSAEKAVKITNRGVRTDLVALSPFSLAAGILDPFQTLAVDSSRLQSLLADRKFRLVLKFALDHIITGTRQG